MDWQQKEEQGEQTGDEVRRHCWRQCHRFEMLIPMSIKSVTSSWELPLSSSDQVIGSIFNIDLDRTLVRLRSPNSYKIECYLDFTSQGRNLILAILHNGRRR